MFEAAELGRKLSKKEFQAVEPDLHTRLLEAQQLLKKSNTSVIIIVSGVEGAGKGEVVNRLSEWLDTRDIKNHSVLGSNRRAALASGLLAFLAYPARARNHRDHVWFLVYTADYRQGFWKN